MTHSTKERSIAVLALTLTAAWAGNAWTQDQSQGAAPQQQAPQQGQPAPEVMQEMQEIRTQLDEVNQRLAAAQQQAMVKPEVQKEQVNYEQALTEAVVAENPELEEAVRKRQQLVENLQGSPELQKPEQERTQEFQEKLDEYRQIEQTIAPKRNEVAQKPEIAEKRQQVEAVLIAEMSKIEPQANELLDARAKLTERFQQLQR
ncbi:MAG: hypothetical protein WD342_02370 [Verrucomicrobiales bacterium]